MTDTAGDFYALSPDDQLGRLQQLAHVALEQWPGIFERVTPVKYRENAVFSAYDTSGRRFALRIHRHGYHSDDALRSELQWMRELTAHGVHVPPVVPTRDGAVLAMVTCPGIPEIRQVDLLEWLAGDPIGSSEDGVTTGDHVAPLYERIGHLASKVHDQATAWTFPDDFTRHAWDADGLLGPDPLWGRFWELPALSPDQQQVIGAARERARSDLTAFGTGLDRYGMIHADFVPENLLDDGETLRLIDFDDSGFGWHMFEMATALFFNLDSPDYATLRDALFRGYRSARSLPDDHEAMLPLFLFLRGTTYMGWVQTRPETQTAQEIGPMIIARTCALAEAYLAA
jgi:Ser/Thr protein kinase RdoA (MazF antagonist)